eukprot:3292967-Amphidinium_carterae.1
MEGRPGGFLAAVRGALFADIVDAACLWHSIIQTESDENRTIGPLNRRHIECVALVSTIGWKLFAQTACQISRPKLYFDLDSHTLHRNQPLRLRRQGWPVLHDNPQANVFNSDIVHQYTTECASGMKLMVGNFCQLEQLCKIKPTRTANKRWYSGMATHHRPWRTFKELRGSPWNAGGDGNGKMCNFETVLQQLLHMHLRILYHTVRAKICAQTTDVYGHFKHQLLHSILNNCVHTYVDYT